jgi:hypothetical protein
MVILRPGCLARSSAVVDVQQDELAEQDGALVLRNGFEV